MGNVAKACVWVAKALDGVANALSRYTIGLLQNLVLQPQRPMVTKSGEVVDNLINNLTTH